MNWQGLRGWSLIKCLRRPRSWMTRFSTYIWSLKFDEWESESYGTASIDIGPSLPPTSTLVQLGVSLVQGTSQDLCLNISTQAPEEVRGWHVANHYKSIVEICRKLSMQCMKPKRSFQWRDIEIPMAYSEGMWLIRSSEPKGGAVCLLAHQHARCTNPVGEEMKSEDGVVVRNLI